MELNTLNGRKIDFSAVLAALNGKDVASPGEQF